MTKIKVKFYAVRVGRKPGIYVSWDDCRQQVERYSGAEFKGFTSADDAKDYMAGKEPPGYQLPDVAPPNKPELLTNPNSEKQPADEQDAPSSPTLRGSVVAVQYESEDKNYSVFRMELSDKFGGKSPTVTVVWRQSAPFEGEELELEGGWVEHAKFGRQFVATSGTRLTTANVDGIRRFLAGGAVPGIGPELARRLVAYFLEDTLRVIGEEPKRLREVPGIGKVKAEAIHNAYKDISDLRDLMLFLENNGISARYAAKLAGVYGKDAKRMIQENPYRLADEIDGIGFKKADAIALSLGIPNDSPFRIRAGVAYALNEEVGNGHCFIPAAALCITAMALLGIDEDRFYTCLDAMVAEGAAYIETPGEQEVVYPAYLYRAEVAVSQRFQGLLAAEGLLRRSEFNVDEWLSEWEHQHFRLADAQREAVTEAATRDVLVLTGGPGTGKTSTIQCLLDLFVELEYRVMLAAPTGRAAKRMSEATGREALTIHRLLGYGMEGRNGFFYDENNPLDTDVVILDESSMIDLLLMNSVLKALSPGTKLVLVGDVDQLPSVSAGTVLRDVIESGAIPVVRLTQVFRQAHESPIIHNAHRINSGEYPDTRSHPDFCFLECPDNATIRRRIVDACANVLPGRGFDPTRDVQVISPMRKNDLGSTDLNRHLQEALNPGGGEDDDAIFRGVDGDYRPGDKVMQVKNNYEKNVFNGDIGIVCGAAPSGVVVTFPELTVTYTRAEADQLQLAYAMTVHKSQGAEYPVIIMPLTSSHMNMLQRNLLYTAVTRASKKVILFGMKRALAAAVHNNKIQKRNSLLAQRLAGCVAAQ